MPRLYDALSGEEVVSFLWFTMTHVWNCGPTLDEHQLPRFLSSLVTTEGDGARWFPDHTTPCPIASESYKILRSITIQTFNRISQPAFRLKAIIIG